MKFTPTVWAARSNALAKWMGEAVGQAPATMPMGVTEMRLLMMGMPYCLEMSSPVFTRCSAYRQILS